MNFEDHGGTSIGKTTVSSIYAEFVACTRFENLSPETVQQTKKVILDLMGVSLAGYQAMAFPKMPVTISMSKKNT